jgi:hypothetical protein
MEHAHLRSTRRAARRVRVHDGPSRLLVAAACVGLAGLGALLIAGGRRFVVYDNMYYRGMPNTTPFGLVRSNIVYENKIWPHKRDVGGLPTRFAFDSTVRPLTIDPGPVVIDIESLPLTGSPDAAARNARTLATLADWMHQSAPGKVVGFYGTNTLSKVPPPSLAVAGELAAHVDAFFPPVYTFDDDRDAYERRAQAAAAEAHDLGPAKPVYFYLWPQYHDGTPKAFQYVSADYWAFQLATARRLANGIVIWSPSRFTWDDSSRWWTQTEAFMVRLRRLEGR